MTQSFYDKSADPTEPLELKVWLEANDGKPVHETTVPPFSKQPDVIIWGVRMFLFHSYDAIKGEFHYREGFAYFAP